MSMTTSGHRPPPAGDTTATGTPSLSGPPTLARGRHTDPDDGCFTDVGNWVTPPLPWPAALEDPEQVAANREVLRHLEGELRKLPDAWRAAVVLCDVEGLAPQDAAAVLNVEDGNLRVLLHRGRARLRQGIVTLLQKNQV